VTFLAIFTKQVNATLPKKLHNAVKKVKDSYGYTWPEFLIEAAKKLDQAGALEEELDKPADEYLKELQEDSDGGGNQ
jgi:hypothetical protein